mmetsp:Transcript_32094/g.46261  ORF Transcript_32094/g.46261 Transcript_32094/m.46261 type:complete len:274 (-) Transcript_32094:1259-2080(-)
MIEFSILTISIVIFVLCFIALVLSIVFIILYCRNHVENVNESKNAIISTSNSTEISESKLKLINAEEKQCDTLENSPLQENSKLVSQNLTQHITDSEEIHFSPPSNAATSYEAENDDSKLSKSLFILKNEVEIVKKRKSKKPLDRGSLYFKSNVKENENSVNGIKEEGRGSSNQLACSLIDLVSAHYSGLHDRSQRQYISLDNIYSLKDTISIEIPRMEKSTDSVSMGDETSSLSTFSASPTASKILSADDLRRLKQKIRMLKKNDSLSPVAL